jgi:hypothetical protein
MTKYIAAFFALMILVGTSSVSIAAGDTYTCSLASVYECLPGEGCTELSIDDMDLPRFVRFDLKAKTITSLDKAVPRNSKIASIERLNRMAVMHGTELRGYSIALGEDSGNLTLTASGDGEGFVAFGFCMDN